MKEIWSHFVRLDLPDRAYGHLQKTGLTQASGETWVNAVYQVTVQREVETIPGWPSKMIMLAIKRRDKKAVHDWRELQRVKNEVIGPEYEGMEMFPAESRLLDTSNIYFMFVFADPKIRWPFGFGNRWVSNVSENGSVQRPFNLESMPEDCRTVAEYKKHRDELELVEKVMEKPV